MILGLNGIFNTIKDNKLHIELTADCINKDSPMEIFYCSNGVNTQFEQSKSFAIDEDGVHQLKLPTYDITDLRIDFGNTINSEISFKCLEYGEGYKAKGYNTLYFDGKSNVPYEVNDIEIVGVNNSGELILKTVGNDPYIAIHNIQNIAKNGVVKPNYVYKAIAVILPFILTLLLYKYVHFKKILKAFKEFYSERKLVFNLAVNDFKTRFAGSSFGTIWAFVQPICTILVFWFVFQVGFRNPDIGDVEYILWFMTGLIPWFFFSEAWNSATNAFIEYSYLVKKVVFKINILPFIKIISALFVHLFFVVFMMVVYGFYGRFPTVYYLQIFYYMFCMIVLVSALSFVTAPLIIFFRDIGQIMNIVLQFGMWLTPIMWSVDNLPQGMGTLVSLFKINPMYYIVQGYRNSMIYKIPFYANTLQTVYFWSLIAVLIIIGNTIYTRLKPHFADVL